MNLVKTPVRFTCTSCGTDWYVPPSSHCPVCGPHAVVSAEPEDCVRDVGHLPDWPRIHITGMLENPTRFHRVVTDHEIGTIIDLAGNYEYVWRPDDSQCEELEVKHRLIEGIDDNLTGWPEKKLWEVCLDIAEAITVSETGVLVHCAAGLRRAPHMVYAWLRLSALYGPVDAWDQVERARPRAYMHKPYIDSIEHWLSKL